MAIPQWTYQSNTSLGTFQERIPVSIPILVFDRQDISDIKPPFNETHAFIAQDSTLLPNYADEKFFYIKSNGIPGHQILSLPFDLPPAPQKYVFKFPRKDWNIFGSRTTIDPRASTDTPALGFIGVAIDGVPFKSPNTQNTVTRGQRVYTENSVIFPTQYYYDGSGIIGTERKFYYQSDPKKTYEKQSNQYGHSPIVGYAFDGNPIYGPYGFSDAFPPRDSEGNLLPNTPVKVMETSYRLSEVQRDNGTLPDGTFIEDFVYEEGLGDLDRHNGRNCVTPEYPDGVYAYFITVDPTDIDLPRYPYIIGPTYRNEPLLPNGSFDFPGEIKLEVISGRLPNGLRIEGQTIIGVPFEVRRDTPFRFVLRATNIFGVSDRTYSITIQGPDAPIWTTPAGDLLVGEKGQRQVTVNKRLFRKANIGDTTLRVSSVFNIMKNSVLSSPNSSNSISEKTLISSIDPISKTVSLSKPLVGEIPLNQQLFFTSTFTHQNLFVLDNSYIDYQLSAIDNDLSTGERLEYYIPPRGGELPPGLTLSRDGKITGFTQPILVSDFGEFNGNYDMQLYDRYAYDYGVRPFNGYDSYLFDTTVYDFSDPVRNPKKLSRFYQFVVRVTDGLYYTDRRFRIYVVGDDLFRADTTIMKVADGMYTADVSYLRKPMWLTGTLQEDGSYSLGRRRANNYITTFLDVYESPTISGIVGYILDPINNDGTISQLPPGMSLDQIKGEIYGDVPYQPAVTKTYKFTVRAIRYDQNSPLFAVPKTTTAATIVGQQTLQLNDIYDLRVGSLMTGPSGSSFIVPGTIVTGINNITRTISINTYVSQTIPTGTTFTFTYLESSARTFKLDIIGEIDSTISFKTSGDLGSIPANFNSELAVVASSNVPNAFLTYTLIGGKLPPGLTLIADGTIQGKVRQYSEGVYKSYWRPNRQYTLGDIVRNEDGLYYKALADNISTTFSTDFWARTELDINGLTIFDKNKTYFETFLTSIDREFKFIVLAQDQFQYSAVTKIFSVKVTTPNELLYSNLYVKPFLKSSKRLELVEFFTNPDIFEVDKIYRPSDPAFGVQNELKMLVYAGIETKDAAEYAAALGRNSTKRYRFGKIKKAIAKTPGTNNVVYEAVYVEVIDLMENENGSVKEKIDIRSQHLLPQTVNQSRRDRWDYDYYDTSEENIASSGVDVLRGIWTQDKVMSADFDGQYISDQNKSTLYGNSTSNMRKKIQLLGETERNFLPLWMRTPQSFSGIEQGFLKGVVLCYCLPGYGDRIITNIKNLGTDFKNIDFTVDRVIIDSVRGEAGDKYIAFGAREIING